MDKEIPALVLSASMLLILTACGNDPAAPAVSFTKEPEPITEKVEDYNLSLIVDNWTTYTEHSPIEREGVYTGTLLDGVPDGYGTFTATNDDGALWTYTGEFKNGLFDGQGTVTWEESDAVQTGTFIAGLFSPNTPELFNSISYTSTPQFLISEKNMDFMQENLALFPAATEEALKEMQSYIQTDLTYPMMTKTLDGLEGTLYHCDRVQAIDVFQDSLYGHTITAIFCGDDELNFYWIYYDGILPDVYSDVNISFTALPVSPSSFSNVSGGTTNVIVLIGCSVEVV